MSPTKWNVGRVSPLAVSMAGPGLDDLVHYIAERLADATHPEDRLHEVWDAYATTRRDLANAKAHGVENVGMEEIEDSVADAWDDLSPELAAGIRLHDAEARLLAGLLDEAAGRIGAVAA
jgi:hypothetical protein